MYSSAYDFRDFYNHSAGRAVERIVRNKILEFWPDTAGLRIAGFGYTVPYMDVLEEGSERVFQLMPATIGAHQSGIRGEGNTVCLAEESELPIETNSIDRILLVHSIENSEMIGPYLEELWRILKSNGRILIVAPNRIGMWARAEWSPFGHGRPFSHVQLCQYLRDAGFAHEKSNTALFTPPLRLQACLGSSAIFESIGKHLCPAIGGLHFVEAGKQLYAPTGLKDHARIKVRGRGIMLAGSNSSSSAG